MTEKSLSFSDVLGFGWEVMKANFWFFAGIMIVLFLTSFFGELILRIIKHQPDLIPPFLTIPLILALFALDVIIGIGLIKIALSFCDESRPKFILLFDGLDYFWRYLDTGLLYGLIVAAAFIVCALPFGLFAYSTETSPSAWLMFPAMAMASIVATILSIKFSLCFYFVIDCGLDPIKALKASNQATAGAKGTLFVFYVLCGLIIFLCALCLLLGLYTKTPMVTVVGALILLISSFAAVPTITVATALVYRQLSAQTPELAELGVASSAKRIEAAQLNAGIQAGLCIRLAEDSQSGEGAAAVNYPVSGVRPAADKPLSVRLSEETASPSAGDTQPKDKKKSNILLLAVIIPVAVLILIAAGLVGLGFFLRNDVRVPLIPPKVAINGILYSKDNPSIIIEGQILKEGDTIGNVKIIKIDKGIVEFEKEDRRWKQKL